LLREYPRREGAWDSVFAANIIECAMGCEEVYMDAEEGYVPEWARIRCFMFTVDERRKSVEVEFQQRVEGASEETVTRRKRVEWNLRTGSRRP
jgi:hypothetical protein